MVGTCAAATWFTITYYDRDRRGISDSSAYHRPQGQYTRMPKEVVLLSELLCPQNDLDLAVHFTLAKLASHSSQEY